MSVNPVSPPNTPLVNTNGIVRPEWYRFFVSLRRGTGEAMAGEVLTDSTLQGGGMVSSGITIGIADGGVGNEQLRQSLGCSIIGRATSSTGSPNDIVATTDGMILTREGGALAFRARLPSLRLPIRTIAANYTATTLDYCIIADATAGNITVTLPALVAGHSFVVKKIDASVNTVTVSGTIDGAASVVLLTRYANTNIIGGASEWHIIS